MGKIVPDLVPVFYAFKEIKEGIPPYGRLKNFIFLFYDSSQNFQRPCAKLKSNIKRKFLELGS